MYLFSANLFQSHPWSFLFRPFVHHLVLEILSDAHHVHERDAEDQSDEAADLDEKDIGPLPVFFKTTHEQIEGDKSRVSKFVLGSQPRKWRKIFYIWVKSNSELDLCLNHVQRH